MKAVDFISALFDLNPDMSQGGYLTAYDGDSPQRYQQYFGIREYKKGTFIPGLWIYFYDTNDTGIIDMKQKYDPDIILFDGECDIYLWRVE